MAAQPRRAWHSIVLPANLHTALLGQCGPRGLTAAVTEALTQLSRQPKPPTEDRPSRERGTVEITLRLPVDVSDAADQWRGRHGLSRQATVEYAVLSLLGVKVERRVGRTTLTTARTAVTSGWWRVQLTAKRRAGHGTGSPAALLSLRA